MKLNTSEYTNPSALPLKLFTSVLQSRTPSVHTPSLQMPPVCWKYICRPIDSQLVSSLSTRCVLLMLPNMKTENKISITANPQKLLPLGRYPFRFFAMNGMFTAMPAISRINVERME